MKRYKRKEPETWAIVAKDLVTEMKKTSEKSERLDQFIRSAKIKLNRTENKIVVRHSGNRHSKEVEPELNDDDVLIEVEQRGQRRIMVMSPTEFEQNYQEVVE